MANDRLEHFALVERTNNGSDHVHQFEVLPFHVALEQALRIRSEFKKPAVKFVSELSTDRPDRVERLSDKLSLFRRQDGNRRILGPAVFERYVLALDIAGLFQASCQPGPDCRISNWQ